MINLSEHLQESIFSMDDIERGMENSVIDDWLAEYAKGQYKIMVLKNGTRKIRGNMVIKNADLILPLNISLFTGTLSIEHCAAPSIEGLFADMGKLDGTLNITDCPNLINLIGSPRTIEDGLYVTSCKSLSSLEGVPGFVDVVSIMKCGKKFTQNAIKTAVPTATQIMCAEETDEANLLESMMDPVLLRLADMVKKNGVKDFNMNVLFGDHFAIDQITPSMRSVFKMSQDSKKCLTALRKVISLNSYANQNCVLCEDKDGNIISAWKVDNYRTINEYKFYKSNGDPLKNEKVYRKIYSVQSAALNEFDDKRLADRGIVRVYVYNFDATGNTYALGRWELSNNRKQAQAGMLLNTPEQNRQYLQENKIRYRIALQKLKALRNTDQYKETTDKVAKLMERFTKFMQKTIADPKWAGSIQYRISYIYDAFSGKRTYDRGKSHGRDGLITVFSAWSNTIIRKINGQSQSDYDLYTSELERAMKNADERLSDVGM